MPGLSIPKTVNPFDIVQSASGDRQYVVRSIADVDKEIKVLAKRIETAHAFPELVKAFRDDQDLLLERREYLRLTATTGKEPTR